MQSSKISPQWKKTALFALIVGILILGTVTVFRAALFEKSRTDLTVYLSAAEAIHQNVNIYKVANSRSWHYVYLPLLAILLTPFTSLPLWLNAALWYSLSMAALLGTLLGLSKLFQSKQHRFWLCLVCAIVALPPLLNTFTRGQLGAISLYLTLLPFLLDLRGKKFTAGFVLGFAIVLKMSPLLILPFYFLLHRNWRALIGCCVGGLFFAVLFPSIVFTPTTNLHYLWTYFKVLSEGSGHLAWKSYLWDELFTPFAADNQSFYAILTRLHWRTESAFAGHSNALIRNINLGLLMSLLGLITWIIMRGKNFATFHFSDFQNKNHVVIRRFTEYSLLAMVMLFTSPVTQPHHYTPLVLLSAAALMNIELNPRSKILLIISMFVCLIFSALGMLFEPFALIGLPFAGSFLLWLAVFRTQLTSR